MSPALDEPDQGVRVSSRRGYSIVNWRSRGSTHWVVSDVAQAELLAFVGLLEANPQ